MPKEIEAIIRGRVQLVMYRDFAQRKAKSLEIAGIAQNLPNGSVRIIAQGEERNLKKFIGELRKGPVLARVDDVDVIWRDATQKFESFNIVN